MAKIPNEELEQLKREVDLVALVRSKGIELKPHGGKDLVGLSPFTDEQTPSFIVTPGKNLWHCMSSGQGGSVIDFVMKHDGVSFRHAALLLKEQNPHLFGLGRGSGQGGAAVKKSTARKLAAPVSFDSDDQTLLEEVLGYYREALAGSAAALDYLHSRGISDEAIVHFGLGLADRTLGLRLPHKNRKDGAAVRERLERIGIYRDSGHEHFNGCVVFPILDENGHVAEIYGRKIARQKSKIDHLYLPGPHRGIFNPECFNVPALSGSQGDLILCESVIDALTFWCAGLRHVTCIYGTEGFTDELFEAILAAKIRRVYLAYDRDPAGERAAGRDAARLASVGVECLRVKFPAGQDANQYALSVSPASHSLRLLVNAAEWMSGTGNRSTNSTAAKGTGTSTMLAANGTQPDEGAAKGIKAEERTVNGSTVPACAAEGPQVRAEEVPVKAEDAPVRMENGPVRTEEPPVNGRGVPAAMTEEPPVNGRGVPAESGTLVELAPDQPALESQGEDYQLNLGNPSAGSGQGREYRVRGLRKNGSLDSLKVNLRLKVGDLFHLDEVNFYQAKSREAFIRGAAVETRLREELIKRDLGKLLFRLEAEQERRLAEVAAPREEAPPMSEEERAEALELLRTRDLPGRIIEDFERCGVVGELVNKLVGYIATVSRLLTRPLAIVIQSTSAAGKSTLMDSILSFLPAEAKIKYSAMTGQSLYYLGETNLKHKVLAIVEEEGAERASYALKLLQSEGELTIASTGKNSETGRMETQEYHVEGPVMIFLTTTAIDIDEELLNRCLVLTVDEEHVQTGAIHAVQRHGKTTERLARMKDKEHILRTHHNAQRLLKPVNVVNPYAPFLTFRTDRVRCRRDHAKYLELIESITLLHQYQRETQSRGGFEFIETSLEDIALANQITHEVLGRSLDELPPQTRRFLLQVKAMVEAGCRERQVGCEDYHFTRRQVREHCGLGETQTRQHLQRLADMEYLVMHQGKFGQLHTYELLYDGPGDHGKHCMGLIDITELKRHYDAHLAG